MARKENLGTDSEGRFRRSIGWKLGPGGKAVQHLFRLGKDEGKAKLANSRLEQLWQCVKLRHERQQGEGKAADPRPLWDETTLAIGGAVAKGEAVCKLQPPPEVSGLAVEMQVAWLGTLQRDFPVIPLQLADPDFYSAGVNGIRAVIEVKQGLLSTLKEPLTTKTVHQGLDAYSAYLGEKQKGKPSLRPQQRAVALLKKHVDDLNLGALDADRIDTWLASWCRRPERESGERLAFDTCDNTLVVLRQFLRWLSRSPQFDWTLPPGYMFPRCRIDQLPGDRAKRLKRVHFKRSELQTIWRYAKPWERALIVLALNCGFSKREIATLQPEEVVKGKKYTFVKRHRTKTEAYGEWVLWPETLQALEYLAQYRPEGSRHVVVNTAGSPMVNGTPDGNENQVIKNHWDRIMSRVLADYPDFYRLPFKHLRKTGAQMIENMDVPSAAELASMYIAHGENSDTEDPLLRVYAKRPWKKLHRVLFKLRRKLLPVFTSVAEPWEYKKVRTSPLTVQKVLDLRRQGKTQKEIAAAVGLHWVTVGKICRKAAAADEAPTKTIAG